MPGVAVHVRRRRAVALATIGLISLLVLGSAATLETPAPASAAVPGPAAAPAMAPVVAAGMHKVTAIDTTGMRRIDLVPPARSAAPLRRGASRPQPTPMHLTQGPLANAARQNAALSTNWSGQILTGGTYTGVEAHWTVPFVAPSASARYSATWVGIDGVGSQTLIQTGTAQDTSGGATDYFAWVELLPGNALAVDATVAPGDVMHAQIVETAADVWNIALVDVTANWVFTSPFAYSTPGLSAEWIEEAPLVAGAQSTLADFGRATFSNMGVAQTAGDSTLDPVYMTNQNGTAIIAYPGAFEAGSSGFTDYYGSPPPRVTSISPASGGVAGGTNVTITGDFLQNATAVTFGTAAATFSAGVNGTLNAVAPAESAGTVDLRVTTPGGTSAPSAADRFTFVPKDPVTDPPVTPPSQTSSVGHGYWLVGGDGGIFTFGSAQFHGSTGALRLSRPVVGITPTASRNGYWLDAADGGVFAFGDAGFYGSVPGSGILPAGTPGPVRRLDAPVVGMVPSASGRGYFMVASDGGVFAFGDAEFEGSCPGIGSCSGAAVAVMPDASGHGYWLVTATGNVYTFGDAQYLGAPGNQGSPVTSAVRTADGRGYWILFANGLVTGYGDAASLGGPSGVGGLNPATAIFSTADSGGYWVGAANGAVFAYGDAPYAGGMNTVRLSAPIIAATGW